MFLLCVYSRNLNVIFEICMVVVMTSSVVHREAESQLSSDTDLDDPDGKHAKTGKGMVCFSNLWSSCIPFPYLSMCNQGHREAWASPNMHWVEGNETSWTGSQYSTGLTLSRNSVVLRNSCVWSENKLMPRHCLHQMSVMWFSPTLWQLLNPQ